MGFIDSFVKGVASAFTGNPLGAISGAAGAIGSIKNLFGGNSNSKAQQAYNDRVLAANQAENEATRKFQREQSDLQWERTQQMFNMVNEYNDPSAARARMVAAGFNPNLLNGMNTAAQGITPALGSGGSAGLPAHGMTAPTPQNDALQKAQINLLNSQAEKNKNDIDVSAMLAKSQIDVNGVQVKLMHSQEGLNNANVKLTEAQEKAVYKGIEETTAKINMLEEQLSTQFWITEKTSFETISAKFEALFKQETFQDRIQRIKNETKLSEKQIAECMSRICLNYAQAKTESAKQAVLHEEKYLVHNQNHNEYLRGLGLAMDNQRLGIQVELDKDFAGIERGINCTADFVGALFDAVNLKNAFFGKSKTSTTTYSGNTSTTTTRTH